MPFPKDHKYTAEEFFKLTPESNSERYELINGEIFALAAPSEIHQTLSLRIASILDSFILSNKGKCKAMISPFDVLLDDNNVVQPDVMVICDRDKMDGKRCNGAPDFVVEITSSNYAHDYIDKLALYRKSGVREYWIVDPQYERIMVYFFDTSDFPNIYTFDTPIPPQSIDGIKRRCNAGMGRCQGGFCSPRVAKILERKLNIPATEVLQDKAGSNIIVGKR